MKVQARYLPATEAVAVSLAAARQAYIDARREGARLITNTRKKAAAHVQRTRVHARQQGIEEGKIIGSKSMLAEACELQRRFETALLNARSECLDLAFRIASQIIEDEVKSNRQITLRRIRRVIDRLLGERAVTIFVCEAEADEIRSEMPRLLHTKCVTVEPSRDICAGDARIKTVAGEIEFKWRDHLEALRDRLLVQSCR